MKQALIAGTFVIGGILLALTMLLFLQPFDFSNSATPERRTHVASQRGLTSEILDAEEIEHFVYIDSCGKYVMENFLKAGDIFEKNKGDLRPRAMTTIQEAGKNLVKLLDELKNEGRGNDYTLILEGNLTNEWTDKFERNNTWAYRLSYERALIVYKVWLKDEIDLRKYGTEVVISGGGYYGICPTKDLKAKRFSVQLVPKK